MNPSSIIALLLIGAALAHPEFTRAKRESSSLDDSEILLRESTDTSESASGDESSDGSGEGSGEVPVDSLTLKQLETLNTFAQKVQAESQKLIHQANFVITEMTSLSSNAQNLGILSNLVLANSQIVLDKARTALNQTEDDKPASSTCVASSVCYNDSGCGSGKCVGALAGTCNCNSCLYGWPCQEDSACGGFVGACNNVTSTCDCFSAYTKHNLTLTQALTSFCNVAKCNGAEDNIEKCHGLPCNYGFCVC